MLCASGGNWSIERNICALTCFACKRSQKELSSLVQLIEAFPSQISFTRTSPTRSHGIQIACSVRLEEKHGQRRRPERRAGSIESGS